jgi:hypothetical protein
MITHIIYPLDRRKGELIIKERNDLFLCIIYIGRNCVYDKLNIQDFWNVTPCGCKDAYRWAALALKMNATRSFELSGTTRSKAPSHPKRTESSNTPFWKSKISKVN